MTEVRFYHLQSQRLEQALPAILIKATERGHRVLVKAESEAQAEGLNKHLWTFDAASFLPHGSQKDGDADRQPIFLTHTFDNPNKADVLVLTDGSAVEDFDGYALCCDMFDGNNHDAVQSARTRWKSLKEAGVKITYWQQNERGGWSMKAEENSAKES